MATALPVLVLLAGFGLAGYILMRRHFTEPETWALVTVPLSATLVVTAVRYQIAVGGSAYEALTSDTFRYLLYGRARWVNGEAIAEGLTTRDGTTGTITLSQIGFLVLGDQWFAVFLAGSLFGLLGCWLVAATIRVVIPGASVGFAFIACLFPSVLYWSSSFGKEAFSMLAVGLAAHALARRSTGSAGRTPLTGLVGLLAAVTIAWTVRPEVAVLIIGAAVAAWLAVRPAPDGGMRRSVVALGLVGAPLGIIVASAAGFSDPFGLLDDLTSRHERTSIGDAQIGAARPAGVTGLLLGIPTAVFRPLPWEAGLAGLGSSLDTVIILYALYVLWHARGRLGALDTASSRLLIFALGVALVLFGPLAGYGNLGLLARMRSMLIPALIIVIAICVHARKNAPFMGVQQDSLENSADTRRGLLTGAVGEAGDPRSPRAGATRDSQRHDGGRQLRPTGNRGAPRGATIHAGMRLAGTHAPWMWEDAER